MKSWAPISSRLHSAALWNPRAHASSSTQGFDALMLPSALREAVNNLGWQNPSTVQASALPHALAGKDVIAQAMTGSGKTAAFALPLLSRLINAGAATHTAGTEDLVATELLMTLEKGRAAGPSALVLCPTRELVGQVSSDIRRLACCLPNTRVLCLVGGEPKKRQKAALGAPHGSAPQIVVGTPGRVLDHLESGALQLSTVSNLVLDEADRMLDMGFYKDIAKIAAACGSPEQRQTLLFSATYTDQVRQLAKRFMRTGNNQLESITTQTQLATSQVSQHWVKVADPSDRLAAVASTLSHFRPERAVAFCNTKASCKQLTTYLQQLGHYAVELHGDLEQIERDHALIRFGGKGCTVLVATDVAARGLDVVDLPMVINVEVTKEPDVHVHRVGRTGRAGNTGLAVSLASPSEMYAVQRIAQLQDAEPVWLDLTASVAAPAQQPPMRVLKIVGASGRKSKIRAGDVLGALTSQVVGIEKTEVGAIMVTEHATFVAVVRAVSRVVETRLRRVKGKAVRVAVL